ncbi:hypothetical protein [Ehrlichia ruminantium]|uniref:hypothetical protein n=1 Tax=Ehrlichia ruminantium TaxID=779 RepID=UPI0003090206|nr:hypothetical protein [Ehrlichia ruminantium]
MQKCFQYQIQRGGGESLVEENSSADGQVPGYMLQDSYIGLCVGHRFCSVDMRM